jgi:hypothetical protein
MDMEARPNRRRTDRVCAPYGAVGMKCLRCKVPLFHYCNIHACVCEAVYVNYGKPRCIMWACVQAQKERVG